MSAAPAQERCPVCNGAPWRVHRVREMMFGLGDEFRYGECAACPLLWRIDTPTDWARYYPPTYGSFEAPRRGAIGRLAVKWRDRRALTGRGVFGGILERRNPERRLRALRPLRPAMSARILDVGAGEGSLVRALRGLGFAGAVGIDPFLAADVTQDGRPLVLRRRLEEMEGPFDVVMFHHSFEHMDGPREVLERTRRLLAPGGACLVCVPVFPSDAWERYGANWVQLDAPRHAVILSVPAIERLAQETGFAVSGVQYDSGVLQFWGSEMYSAGQPLRDPTTGRREPRGAAADPGRLREWAREADRLNREGRGDQAAFVLRAT